METAEARLARHAATLAYRDIPEPALDGVRRLLIDTAAVVIAALRSGECGKVRDELVRRGGAPESSLTATETRVPAASAALINGMQAHWYEWDDVYDPGAVHGSAVIFPALLAAMEAQGGGEDGPAAGRAFLEAATAAFDIAGRVGEMLMLSAHDGWMPTGIAGSIGAAAGVARIFGLDRDGILAAMGIAAASTITSRQPIKDKVNCKNTQAGLAAAAAVNAATLARAGIAGPPNFLFGDYGFNVLLADGRRSPDAVINDLGQRFVAPAVSIKPYPSCRSTHGGIDMALDFLKEEPEQQGRVETVEVGTSKVMFDLVGGPFRPGGNPRVAAQFSLPYTVALAFAKARVSIDDFDAERILADTEVLDLARRIDHKAEPPPWAAAGDVYSQTMVIRLANGEVRERSASVLRGMPERPLTDEEHLEKVRDAAKGFLPPSGIDALAEACRRVAEDGPARIMHWFRQAGA